jgi:hypothetical protein
VRWGGGRLPGGGLLGGGLAGGGADCAKAGSDQHISAATVTAARREAKFIKTTPDIEISRRP